MLPKLYRIQLCINLRILWKGRNLPTIRELKTMKRNLRKLNKSKKKRERMNLSKPNLDHSMHRKILRQLDQRLLEFSVNGRQEQMPRSMPLISKLN